LTKRITCQKILSRFSNLTSDYLLPVIYLAQGTKFVETLQIEYVICTEDCTSLFQCHMSYNTNNAGPSIKNQST